MEHTKIHPAYLPFKHLYSLKTKVARPGSCGDRIVTLVVQVKDSYGATSTCGGMSAPDDVHACPTAMVHPYTGTIDELLKELEKAAKSVSDGKNAISSSDMLTQTMAVKTAKGDKCLVSTVPSLCAVICLREQNCCNYATPVTSKCRYATAYRSACQTAQFRLPAGFASVMK